MCGFSTSRCEQKKIWKFCFCLICSRSFCFFFARYLLLLFPLFSLRSFAWLDRCFCRGRSTPPRLVFTTITLSSQSRCVCVCSRCSYVNVYICLFVYIIFMSIYLSIYLSRTHCIACFDLKMDLGTIKQRVNKTKQKNKTKKKNFITSLTLSPRVCSFFFTSASRWRVCFFLSRAPKKKNSLAKDTINRAPSTSATSCSSGQTRWNTIRQLTRCVWSHTHTYTLTYIHTHSHTLTLSHTAMFLLCHSRLIAQLEILTGAHHGEWVPSTNATTSHRIRTGINEIQLKKRHSSV